MYILVEAVLPAQRTRVIFVHISRRRGRISERGMKRDP